MCGPSFNFVGLSVLEKFWRLKIGKKNEEIKGIISGRSLVLFHIKPQMVHNICTKSQSPMCNVQVTVKLLKIWTLPKNAVITLKFEQCGKHYLSAQWRLSSAWASAQRRLRSAWAPRPVWSESSLCSQWVAKDPSFRHVDSEDSD